MAKAKPISFDGLDAVILLLMLEFGDRGEEGVLGQGSGFGAGGGRRVGGEIPGRFGQAARLAAADGPPDDAAL